MKKSKLLILPGILFILLISCSDSNDKLYTAIAKGSLSEVEEIIESGVDINYKYENDRNKSEHTALHYAVKYHEYDIAELLIEKGANVNAVDIYGWHPLLHAVNDGNLKLAELLLKNGADLEQKNTETGSTSIDYAGRNNDTKMINLLLKYEPKKDKHQQDKVVEEVYLIPNNYIGTIDIYFDAKDGTEKEYKDSVRIFRIPKTGVLKTKFPYCKGTYLKDSRKYYYLNNNQRTKLPMTMNIHAEIDGIAVFKDFDIKENNKIIGSRYYVDSLKNLDKYIELGIY